MKTSELIKKLEGQLAKHGDLPIRLSAEPGASHPINGVNRMTRSDGEQAMWLWSLAEPPPAD